MQVGTNITEVFIRELHSLPPPGFSVKATAHQELITPDKL